MDATLMSGEYLNTFININALLKKLLVNVDKVLFKGVDKNFYSMIIDKFSNFRCPGAPPDHQKKQGLHH